MLVHFDKCDIIGAVFPLAYHTIENNVQTLLDFRCIH